MAETTYFEHVAASLPYLLRGAGYTVGVAMVSMAFGLALGLAAALGKLSASRPLRYLSVGYIDLFRGTPLLVQILFIYFGVPNLLQQIFGQPMPLNPLAAGVIAFSLNAGAYIAEIFRAGIRSVDPGQTEAARSLGLTGGQAFRHVVFPQAFRRVVPPLGNEFIVLLKDTSLLSAIAVTEVLKEGQLYIARTYAAFPTYLAIALVYLGLTVSASKIVGALERRFPPR